MKVTAAERLGFSSTVCRPCSSMSMVSTQSWRSWLMVVTIASRMLPLKPLRENSWRISSRSPAGTRSMCSSSMRRACSRNSRWALIAS
ncbi:hypothetical protein D3C80_1891670 [compost metagenome]